MALFLHFKLINKFLDQTNTKQKAKKRKKVNKNIILENILTIIYLFRSHFFFVSYVLAFWCYM